MDEHDAHDDGAGEAGGEEQGQPEHVEGQKELETDGEAGEAGSDGESGDGESAAAGSEGAAGDGETSAVEAGDGGEAGEAGAEESVQE